jgi:hypothetical protein
MATKRAANEVRQELFARSLVPVMPIEDTHPYVVLADRLDWEKLSEIAERVRRQRGKTRVGRQPHLRALVGAVVLMGLRRVPYRELEDQAKYYAPARYLMGLTETTWTPNYRTVNDFTQMLGEDGIKALNQDAVILAVQEGRADPREISADTTAQEAAIPYPNEMGLMAQFFSMVKKAVKSVGGVMKETFTKLTPLFQVAHEKLRGHRFFAKTSAERATYLREMMEVVATAQGQLAQGLAAAAKAGSRISGRAKAAWATVQKVHATMTTLLPQIVHWVETGFVASGKIVSLQMPTVYSVVRGKVGKAVEFGLHWGMTRLRGGFLLATLAKHRKELVDSRFVGRAVDDHQALFGEAPRSFAYDRGGYSKANVQLLKAKGVKEVGLAPRGQAPWEVGPRTRQRLMTERAKIEGCIGTVKCQKYGFNKPAAKSAEMMGACGQRAVLGFNLYKLAKAWTVERMEERAG